MNRFKTFTEETVLPTVTVITSKFSEGKNKAIAAFNEGKAAIDEKIRFEKKKELDKIKNKIKEEKALKRKKAAKSVFAFAGKILLAVLIVNAASSLASYIAYLIYNQVKK